MRNVILIRHYCILVQHTVYMVAIIIGGFNNGVLGRQNASTQIILVWDPKDILYVIFRHSPLAGKQPFSYNTLPPQWTGVHTILHGLRRGNSNNGAYLTYLTYCTAWTLGYYP